MFLFNERIFHPYRLKYTFTKNTFTKNKCSIQCAFTIRENDTLCVQTKSGRQPAHYFSHKGSSTKSNFIYIRLYAICIAIQRTTLPYSVGLFDFGYENFYMKKNHLPLSTAGTAEPVI